MTASKDLSPEQRLAQMDEVWDKAKRPVRRTIPRHQTPGEMWQRAVEQNESFGRYGQWWATRSTGEERAIGARRVAAALDAVRASKVARPQA
jgi:hypothetical protein